jgi:MFS transporter, SHS family, lactate transporter
MPLPVIRKLSEVNRDQWRAFLATFLGWVLDGFDFTILTFIIIDIEKSFTIDSALAGALGTVTMLMRLVGGIAAGTAADRWGRKLPLMLSILWFSIFAFLSGFSTSYAMLFAFRALFGIGMGGEWAAGMPLTLEHWPAHLRGTASGMLQSGFGWGYILSAVVFQTIYPFFQSQPNIGWRAMFWIGVIPALLVLWIRKGVSESPVWLERQRHLAKRQEKDSISLLRIFKRDLLGVTIHTSLVLTVFMFSYHSTTFWYATHLRQSNLQPFWYIILLNVGGILGSWTWGTVSETRVGRKGAATFAAVIGILVIPLYLMTKNPTYALVGAFFMGFGGTAIWAIIPSYLTERFPTAARGVGPGFAYHVGAAMGSIIPTLIGALKDHGLMLNVAMALFIAGSFLLVIVLMWAGPETKGVHFSGADEQPLLEVAVKHS